MTLNNYCDLNSAIIEAFKNQYLILTSRENHGLIEKVKIYVKKTMKPLKTSPRYHQEAKNFIRSLWSQNQSAREPQKFLLKLSAFEYKKRLRAVRIGSRFRDHIAHSASVFLLGLVLIDRCNAIQEAFNHWSLSKSMSKNDYIESWMWCATLHDLGYPVEIDNKEDKNRDHVEKKPPFISMEQWACLENFFQANLYRNNIKTELKEEFLKKTDKRHGLASAAIALDFFYGNRQSSKCDRIIQKDFEHIIMAISFHDKENGQKFLKIKLKEYPLIYLLILCDELQCWNRPSKKTSPFIRSDDVTIETDNVGDKDKIQINIKSIYKTEEKRMMLEHAHSTLKGKLDMRQLQLEISINGKVLARKQGLRLQNI